MAKELVDIFVVRGSLKHPGKKFYVVDSRVPVGTKGRVVDAFIAIEDARHDAHARNGFCRTRVHGEGGWWPHSCTRKAKVGGYCGQHAKRYSG